MSNSDILLKENSGGSRGSLEADDAPDQAHSLELLELIDVESHKKQSPGLNTRTNKLSGVKEESKPTRHQTEFLPNKISRPFGGLFQRPLLHAVQEQSRLVPSQTQLLPSARSCDSFEGMSSDAQLVPPICPYRPFEGSVQPNMADQPSEDDLK